MAVDNKKYNLLDFINRQQERELMQMNSKSYFCNHELVLYLGKQTVHGDDIGLAICLECERTLYLNGIDKDLEIEPESIIDITGIIPNEYIYAYDGSRNVLAARAKEKLLVMAIGTVEMPLEEVKQNIIEDLVYYTDELEYRKVIPRKRSRKLSKWK